MTQTTITPRADDLLNYLAGCTPEGIGPIPNEADALAAVQKALDAAALEARNKALEEAADLMDRTTCYTELGNTIRALKTQGK